MDRCKTLLQYKRNNDDAETKHGGGGGGVTTQEDFSFSFIKHATRRAAQQVFRSTAKEENSCTLLKLFTDRSSVLRCVTSSTEQ